MLSRCLQRVLVSIMADCLSAPSLHLPCRGSLCRYHGSLQRLTVFLHHALTLVVGDWYVNIHPNRRAPRCLPCDYADPLMTHPPDETWFNAPMVSSSASKVLRGLMRQ